MKVTLDMFSGRPNPTWKLSTADARRLIDRTGPTLPAPAPAAPGRLGVRGVTVELEPGGPEARAPLPPKFVLAVPSVREAAPRATPSPAARAAASIEPDTLQWLIETGRGSVQDALLNAASRSVTERGEMRSAVRSAPGPDETTAVPGEAAAKAMPAEINTPLCRPVLSPYRPYFWNEWPVVSYNNCYNYAANYASNSVSQPGRISNHPYKTFDCDSIRESALADGLKETCDGEARVVALAVWPGMDFHWYRLHPEGFWAHKLGIYTARNWDNQNQLITAARGPANCDRGPYTTFCGFFFVPSGVQVV